MTITVCMLGDQTPFSRLISVVVDLLADSVNRSKDISDVILRALSSPETNCIR